MLGRVRVVFGRVRVVFGRLLLTEDLKSAPFLTHKEAYIFISQLFEAAGF